MGGIAFSRPGAIFNSLCSAVAAAAAVTPDFTSVGIFLLPHWVMESFPQPPPLALEQITCRMAFVGLGRCRQVAVLPVPTPAWERQAEGLEGSGLR